MTEQQNNPSPHPALRLRHTLRGHAGRIYRMALSPDGYVNNEYVKMIQATLSDRGGLVLPLAIHGELGPKPGQEFSVIAKGSVIEPVPLQSIRMARGILKGANPDNYRDRGERVQSESTKAQPGKSRTEKLG